MQVVKLFLEVVSLLFPTELFNPYHGRGAYPLGTTGRWAIPFLNSNTAEIRIITVSSTGIDSRDSDGGSNAISVSQSCAVHPQIVMNAG